MHARRCRGAKLGCRYVVGVAAVVALGWLGAYQPAAGQDAGFGNVVPATLEIGPVDGLTTAWHIAPDEAGVPVGSVLTFRVAAPPDVPVQWTGAFETSRDDLYSTAVCPVVSTGHETVVVQILHEQGPTTDKMTFEVLNVDVDDIDVTLSVTTEQLEIDETLPQEQLNLATMKHYFGRSIAAVSQVGPSAYLTSIDRPVAMSVQVEPPKIAPLIEWRLDGVAQRLGGKVGLSMADVGLHQVTVGPLADEQQVQVETYSVSVRTNDPNLPDGPSIEFIAETNPPGYEQRVTWLSSTKYGTANPVMGSGPSFVMRFHNSWGVDEDGIRWRWVGVKGDHVQTGQDQKCDLDPFGTAFEPEAETQVEFGSKAIPPIPPDFFFPGSPPFLGRIGMVGWLEDPELLGMTDTLVQRAGPVDFPGVGFPRPSDPVEVEIVELKLAAVAPIDVGPSQWLAGMGLSPNGQVPGVLQAIIESPAGGQASAQVPVQPIFVFANQQDLFALQAGKIEPQDVQIRILDFADAGIGPIDMGWDAPMPFSTVPPTDGGFFFECELDNEFPFFPGVPPGGEAGGHGGGDGGVAAPGLPPHIAAGGPGHLHYVCPPPPPPPGLCTYGLLGAVAFCPPAVCPAPPAGKILLPCPAGGPPPCPPGPGPGGCPPFIVVVFPCPGGGFCVGFYVATACCTC